MTYCPYGGRVANEADMFCANCGRRLFLASNSRAESPSSKGHRVSCPGCHGTMFIDDPDCSGKGRVAGILHEVDCPKCHGTGKIKCNYPGCENGQVWIND